MEEAANAVYGGTYKQSPPPSTSSHPSYSSGGQRNQAAYHQQYPSDRTTTTATNGSSYPASGKSTPRTRTYSTPYGSDLPNGLVNGNGNARPKYTATKSSDPVHSFSPRPVDVKPTRIPKVSRTPTSPYTNGYGQSHSPPVTVSDLQEYGVLQQRTGVPSSSTRSTIDIPRTTGSRTGLLNETAPFPTDLTMSSGFSREEPIDDPPRASMESEERPFEHWYRGEVSRNGGVGELRVGRRQEMLDIANYGHLIGNKKPTPRAPPPPDTSGYRRKRAGSIAGMTNKERERGSLYLDDEHANQIGRVLDENPLTDLEDGDEVSVVDSYYHHDEENTDTINEGGGAYAYIPEVDDGQSYTAGAYESNRSTTPTPLHPHSGRPSSRQQSLNQTPTQGPPPTRIPGPASRRSSESRSTMNTTTSHAVGRTPSSSPQMQHQQTASTSSRTSPSPNNLSASRSNTPSSRQQQQRGVSPAPAKSKTTSPPTSTSKIRTPVPKPKMKAKTPPKKVDPKSKEKRESVGQYPMPQGLEDDEEGDMADAIPTWTQPVKGEGNWDEVTLLSCRLRPLLFPLCIGICGSRNNLSNFLLLAFTDGFTCCRTEERVG